MSGSGVPCRAQDGGLQQLLDRIQTVRIRRRISNLDLACGFGCTRIAFSAAPELLFGQFCTCALGKPEEKSLT